MKVVKTDFIQSLTDSEQRAELHFHCAEVVGHVTGGLKEQLGVGWVVQGLSTVREAENRNESVGWSVPMQLGQLCLLAGMWRSGFHSPTEPWRAEKGEEPYLPDDDFSRGWSSGPKKPPLRCRRYVYISRGQRKDSQW